MASENVTSHAATGELLAKALVSATELPGSREKSLVITKIEEAQLWLEKGEKTCG